MKPNDNGGSRTKQTNLQSGQSQQDGGMVRAQLRFNKLDTTNSIMQADFDNLYSSSKSILYHLDLLNQHAIFLAGIGLTCIRDPRHRQTCLAHSTYPGIALQIRPGPSKIFDSSYSVEWSSPEQQQHSSSSSIKWWRQQQQNDSGLPCPIVLPCGE